MIPRNWVYCDGKYYKKYQYLKEDEENIGLENIDDINNKNEYIKTPNLIEKTIFGLNGVDDKNNYNNSFGANSRNIQKFEIPEHRHKLFMHNKEHVKYSYIEYLFQPGGGFFYNIVSGITLFNNGTPENMYNNLKLKLKNGSKLPYIPTITRFQISSSSHVLNYALAPKELEYIVDENNNPILDDNGKKIEKNKQASKYDSSDIKYNLFEYEITINGSLYNYDINYLKENNKIFEILFINNNSMDSLFQNDTLFFTFFFIYIRSLDGLEWWLTLLNLVKNLKKEEGNISYKLIIPDEMSLYGFYTKNKYVLSITNIASLINLFRWEKDFNKNDTITSSYLNVINGNYEYIDLFNLSDYFLKQYEDIDNHLNINILNENFLSNNIINSYISNRIDELYNIYNYQIRTSLRNNIYAEFMNLETDKLLSFEQKVLRMDNFLAEIEKNTELNVLNYIDLEVITKSMNTYNNPNYMNYLNTIYSDFKDLKKFIYTSISKKYAGGKLGIFGNISRSPILNFDFHNSNFKLPFSNLPPNKSLVWIMKI